MSKPKPESGPAETATNEPRVPDIDPNWKPGVPPLEPPSLPTSPLNESKAPPAETPLAETLPPSPPPPPASPNAFLYFKKALVSMPFIANKQQVRFEVLGQNTGVIKLDPAKDAETIAALKMAAEAHRGGIVIIDEETYSDLKKNLLYSPFERRSQPTVRVWETQPRRVLKPASENVAAANPSPVVAGSHGSAPAVVGDGAGAGKPPASFTPNLQRKSEGKGPVLRPPSTGVFKAGAPPPV